VTWGCRYPAPIHQTPPSPVIKRLHHLGNESIRSCGIVTPRTCTLNNPNVLSWTNITSMHNVHVLFCVFSHDFHDCNYIFFINSFMIFTTFFKIFIYKIGKLHGFGSFIFMIFKNKNINPVSVTYTISNRVITDRYIFLDIVLMSTEYDII